MQIELMGGKANKEGERLLLLLRLRGQEPRERGRKSKKPAPHPPTNTNCGVPAISRALQSSSVHRETHR